MGTHSEWFSQGGSKAEPPESTPPGETDWSHGGGYWSLGSGDGKVIVTLTGLIV